MIVIDPLKDKIHYLLQEGEANPLNTARLRYGTKDDILKIEDQVKKITPDARKHIYIDLTPFERIGHIEELITRLGRIVEPRPVLMIMSETISYYIKSKFEKIPLLIVNYSEDGNLLSIDGGLDLDKSILDQVRKDIFSDQKYSHHHQFRHVVADQNLTKILFDPNCLDIPYDIKDSETVKYISPRYFRIMPNKMLVSCYLNLKNLGKDLSSLTTVAYEIVLEITNFFRRDLDSLNSFDLLIAPNNTALFLSSCVQAITGKSVVSIDKLGPIPSFPANRTNLRKILLGKRVIVIEEVVATGNEVDRTIMFLNHMGSKIEKIIAIYNLDVGRSMLSRDGKLVSLCRPKRTLDYVYRSN